VRRLAPYALGAGVVAVAVAIVLATSGYSGYSARVILADAGGLVAGSNVSVGGVTIGQVASLTLDRNDHAVAVVHIDHSAAPLGDGAGALVQIDGFFGERELLLTRGDYTNHPEPSGYTIPASRSGVSVRLDDVVDSLDVSAQGALRTFLDEQGNALVGRGHDLGVVLAELPHTLPSLTALLDQLSSNQRALGDLVERSDRVVGQVAAQRTHLGALVNSANGALGALASRRPQLGQTVDAAPAALRQAQSTLASLEGSSIALAPAADGLRAAAPGLIDVLHEAPRFSAAAVPTLNELGRVAPQLQTLANKATPVVSALVPLVHELTRYSSQALVPFSTLLADKGAAGNLFGEMEGWARSTQGYDASSHIFRFGATLSAASFKQLLALSGLPVPAKAAHHAAAPRTVKASAPVAQVTGAASRLTSPLTGALNRLTSTVKNRLNAVLGQVHQTTGKVVNTATQALSTLTHLGGGSPGASAPAGSSSSDSSLNSLLNYLLGK